MNVRSWWRPVAAIVALLVLTVPALTRAQDSDQNKTDDTEKSGKVDKANKADEADKPEKTKHNESTASKQRKTKPERAKAASLPDVLTHDEPADLSTLDVYDGIGGKEGAPNPNDTYTFLAEDLSQTQPKMDVRDSEGRRWRIKTGIEAKPEIAASRLLWAAGYYADADYYLPELKVTGIRHLRRGGKFVDADGTVHGARLKLMPKGEKDIGYWSWFNNPFMGTREFNGLRVVMALLSNWDLVTRNNKTYLTEGRKLYVVGDLGASFGRSGPEFVRKKGNEGAYEDVKFVVKQTDQAVDFYDKSRPWPFMVLGPHYYRDLVEGPKVVQDIPRADAKWMGDRLSQLTDQQLQDCFRAAGYSDQDAASYAKVLRERISELVAL